MRTKALEELYEELRERPAEYLSDQKNIFFDIFSNAMKRGSDPEQIAAVRLVTWLIFQFGCDEQFSSKILILFSNLLNVKRSSMSMSVKASICTALALIELIDSEHGNRAFIGRSMSIFSQIITERQPDTDALLVKVLEAWALLLTLCSPDDFHSVTAPMIGELREILSDNTTTECRMVCCRVIALIFEQSRISENNFLQSEIPDICDAINNVINDRKNVNNDKRKLLREIVKSIEVWMETAGQMNEK